MMETHRIEVPPSLGQKEVQDLESELTSALSDSKIRVLSLVGGSEVFCRGLDAEALLATEDAEERRQAVEGYQACLRAIRLGAKPTIALVDGPALGGGVGIVAACDVAVATERASFAFPEALFGLIPAMVFPLALERMRPQTLRLWATLASSRSAEEALAAGLVDQVVAPDQLDRANKRWARQLGRARPGGLAKLASFSAKVRTLSVEEALAEGGRITLAASGDPEVRSALRNFREHGVLSWED